MTEQQSLEHEDQTNYGEKLNTIKAPWTSPLGGNLTYVQAQGNFISEKFFRDKPDQVMQEHIDQELSNIKKAQNEIKEVKKQIQADETLSPSMKSFLINTANDIGLKLIMFKKAIYLEANKGGYDLDEDKKTLYKKQLEQIQTMIYGPKISDVPKEKNAVIQELYRLLDQGSATITAQQYEDLKTFLDNFGVKPEKSGINNKSTAEYDKELHLEQVKFIFEKVIQIYGLTLRQEGMDKKDGWEVKIDEGANSVNVNWENRLITIPAKEKTMSVKRVCELIEHEIGVHVLRGENTQHTIGEAAADYSPAEEGFALISQRLIAQDFNDITKTPNITHLFTFMCENLNYEQSIPLIKTVFQLMGKNEQKAEQLAHTRAMRNKRFYPWDMPGANRKDVNYTRGLFRAIDFVGDAMQQLAQGDDTLIKHFYFAKLGKTDLPNVEEIQKELGINTDELVYPSRFGKILRQKVIKGKGTLRGIEQQDPRFQNMEQLTMQQKRQLVEILRIMR